MPAHRPGQALAKRLAKPQRQYNRGKFKYQKSVLDNKVTITLFQILFVAADYSKTNAISRACEAAYRNARRQRIAPFDLRRASLPVTVAIIYNVS